MTDRQAFIDAIRDCPDDDTVRLVYADYLDETGNEDDAALARHIREACEEKGLPDVPPLIEAEEFYVKPHTLGFNGFEAVISPEQAGKLHGPHGLCDINARYFRANDLVVLDRQDEVSSSEKVRVSGVMTNLTGRISDATERDRIRQIRRSVTETRTVILNAFCDKYKLDPSRQEFDNGFVRTLAISLTDLVDNGDAIFAEQPVERVSVTWYDYSRCQTRWFPDPKDNNGGEHRFRFDNRTEWHSLFRGRFLSSEMFNMERLCRETWPKIGHWEFLRHTFSSTTRVEADGVDISHQVTSIGLAVDAVRQSLGRFNDTVDAMIPNPFVDQPLGIIEVPDDPSHAAPLERRSNSRKNSIPPDPSTRRNTRFPRPR